MKLHFIFGTVFLGFMLGIMVIASGQTGLPQGQVQGVFEDNTKSSFDKNVGAVLASDLIEQNKNNSNFIIIDTRSGLARSSGFIENSIHIPFRNTDDFRSRLRQLNPTNTYLVYDKLGATSSRSTDIMLENDFIKIYELDGGIKAWKEAGYETSLEK